MASLILELFHRLPKMASRFLETHGERPGLVVLTIELEEKLAQLALPLPRCAARASVRAQCAVLGF